MILKIKKKTDITTLKKKIAKKKKKHIIIILHVKRTLFFIKTKTNNIVHIYMILTSPIISKLIKIII